VLKIHSPLANLLPKGHPCLQIGDWPPLLFLRKENKEKQKSLIKRLVFYVAATSSKVQ